MYRLYGSRLSCLNRVISPCINIRIIQTMSISTIEQGFFCNKPDKTAKDLILGVIDSYRGSLSELCQ